MPKEISHWLLAAETEGRLADGRVRDSIRSYPELYDLGAVIYDTGFYAEGHSDSAAVLEAGLGLHGHEGEDTYEPLRTLLGSGQSDGSMSMPTVSFVAGCLTHIMGDTYFHSLVNYFCGEYYAEERVQRARSQQRHRRFEAALDLHLLTAADSAPRNGGRLRRTVAASVAAVGDGVEALAAGLYFDRDRSDPPAMLPLMRRHATIQGVFTSPLAGGLARGIGAVFGGAAATLAATFYPPRRREGYALLQGPIEYRHPNTGEGRRESVEEIFDRAAGAGAALLGALGVWAAAGDAAADPFGGERGISLEVGCNHRDYPVIKHTDTSTAMDELLGLDAASTR